eukprot:2773803-Rhodomonas_salina.4
MRGAQVEAAKLRPGHVQLADGSAACVLALCRVPGPAALLRALRARDAPTLLLARAQVFSLSLLSPARSFCLPRSFSLSLSLSLSLSSTHPLSLTLDLSLSISLARSLARSPSLSLSLFYQAVMHCPPLTRLLTGRDTALDDTQNTSLSPSNPDRKLLSSIPAIHNHRANSLADSSRRHRLSSSSHGRSPSIKVHSSEEECEGSGSLRLTSALDPRSDANLIRDSASASASASASSRGVSDKYRRALDLMHAGRDRATSAESIFPHSVGSGNGTELGDLQVEGVQGLHSSAHPRLDDGLLEALDVDVSPSEGSVSVSRQSSPGAKPQQLLSSGPFNGGGPGPLEAAWLPVAVQVGVNGAASQPELADRLLPGSWEFTSRRVSERVSARGRAGSSSGSLTLSSPSRRSSSS